MTASSCRVHLDWDNFRHNLRLLKSRGKTLLPIIKADAYGHGVLRASEELTELGIGWAAIGTLEEGCDVRDHGYRGRIVSLLCRTLSPADVRLAREKRIIPLIHSEQGLNAVADAVRAESSETPLPVAVKVDTGMARLGFRADDMERVAAFFTENPGLYPVLMVSHLSVADVPEEEAYTRMQAERFARAAEIMRRRFPSMLTSLGNTAGLMSHADIVGDLCRPGLAVYGYNPLFGTSREGDCEGMRPVMSVTAPLIGVHPLHKGESLGYGRAYVAESERLVGWVAIGYADAYRRNPAPGTCMCVNGVRVPVIGRVAMQMTCIDLTDLPEKPSIGDDVYVMGGPGHAVTAQDLAEWWGTIPYEVICLLGKNTRA